MFAILVIFLLTNSASVTQWVEVGRNIQLPKAKHSDPPPKAATLQISRDAVFGDNKALISNSQIMQTNSSDSIKTWLMRQGKKGGYVNIVAHERVPYGVIRRVISACQDAGFKNVNLAVQPKS